MSECTHGSIASHCPYCRIAEMEKQELGFIQSLREMEEKLKHQQHMADKEYRRYKELAATVERMVFERDRKDEQHKYVVRKLRRSLDNIKIRSYELGQRELHDMALAALEEK